MDLTEPLDLVEPLDTSRKLQEAGFSPTQANALALVLERTSRHLGALMQGQERISNTVNQLNTRVDRIEIELRLLPWKIFGMMLAVAGLILAGQNLLPILLKWLF